MMKENSKPNLALHAISFCLVFVVGYTVAIVPFDFLPQSISTVSDDDVELSLKTTAQFDPMLGRVQSSYGWERDKHKEFTDAVSDYLIEVGYEEPRKLSTEEDRKWFRDIFRSLADAIKG